MPEAYELVEDELITADDFRDFTFANAVRLWGTQNPRFFEGTVVAKEAAAVLNGHAGRASPPSSQRPPLDDYIETARLILRRSGPGKPSKRACRAICGPSKIISAPRSPPIWPTIQPSCASPWPSLPPTPIIFRGRSAP